MKCQYEKLKKLLALAKRGVGGERENAARMLEVLMTREGISLTDLEGEERKLVWMKPGRGAYARELFHQTIFSVVGKHTTWRSAKRRGYIGVEMTAAEKVEFELRYITYHRSLMNELQVCYKAFVQVNQIFHDQAPAADESQIDEEELKRLLLAMQGMKPVQLRKALQN